jgi:hypothetical protein
MFRKSLFAVALVFPAVALSTATYADQSYRGGPKSGVASVTQSQAAKQFEPNKPYAQAIEERKGKHVYQGGPRSTIPHASH